MVVLVVLADADYRTILTPQGTSDDRKLLPRLQDLDREKSATIKIASNKHTTHLALHSQHIARTSLTQIRHIQTPRQAR